VASWQWLENKPLAADWINGTEYWPLAADY